MFPKTFRVMLPFIFSVTKILLNNSDKKVGKDLFDYVIIIKMATVLPIANEKENAESKTESDAKNIRVRF